LPPKRSKRREVLENILGSPRTQVFYEAPHRLLETMGDIVHVLGLNRQVVIAREVTKIHEEFLRGRAGELLERLKERDHIKGEITLLIGKSEDSIQTAAAKVGVRTRLKAIMNHEKVDEKSALKKLAKELGVSKSEAYRELQRSK